MCLALSEEGLVLDRARRKVDIALDCLVCRGLSEDGPGWEGGAGGGHGEVC